MAKSDRAPGRTAGGRRGGSARHALLLLVLLTVAARLVFCAEAVGRGSGLDQAEPLDPWFYATAGSRLLAGDLDLTGWQEELKARIAEGEDRLGLNTYLLSAQGAETHRRLNGERPLLGGILYTYAVAGALALGSTDWLRVFQVLGVGLLTCLVTYRLTLNVTGHRPTAVMAFGLLAFHSVSVVYSGFLLKPVWIAFFFVLLVWAVDETARRPGRGVSLGLGACLGLIHLTKGILLLCLPLVPLALWLAPRLTRRERLVHGGWILAGFLLVVAPLVVRNLGAGCSPLHVSSQAHVGLVAYHFEGADGSHLVRPNNDYIHAVLQRGGDSHLGVLVATARTHPSAWSYLRLQARKLLGFFNGYEAPNNIDPASAGAWLRTASLFPIPTWFLSALALVGLVASAPRGREYLAVYAGLGILLASVLVTLALARYRLPAAPLFALLAAAAITALRRGSARRRIVLAAALALALVAAWPTQAPPPATEWLVGMATHQRGKPATERSLLERAIEVHPPPRTPQEVIRVVQLHQRLADVCLGLGDRRGARDAYASLVRRFPQSVEARRRLSELSEP